MRDVENGKFTGKFSEKLKTKVVAYQKLKKLPDNGVVESNTWKAMCKTLKNRGHTANATKAGC
jgi:peptidoglycan hydrolase-like protein with peptidoglycan-binding domain